MAIAVTYDAVMRMTVVVVALLAACSSDPGPIIDARLGDAPAVDGQILGDGGANDAPDLDGAPDLDAPALDAPDLDAAALDAAPLDAPALDATPLDAGVDAFVCTADGVACAGGTGVCCGGTCVTGACCTAADCGADPAGFSTQRSVSSGVAGLSTATARLPSSRIAPSVRCRWVQASTWTPIRSAPALA